MLEIKHLSAGYNGKDVISNINFNVQRGESLCVLGPNGSGKSTLLKSIARIIDYRGSVLLDGEDIMAVSRRELAKRIALLSQNAQVYFPYTVYETVSMGRYAYSQGFLKNLSAEDKDIIKDTLEKLDIWDIKENMIDELSGGTLQRVFLARTLTQTPDVILLDEPANHLDLKHQIELLKFLKAWVADNNKTLIGVFHDLNLARHFGDTAIVLTAPAGCPTPAGCLTPGGCLGTIAACGKIDEVLKSGILSDVYNIDIRAFMKESLEKWS